MSKKYRKSLKSEIKSTRYPNPEKGYKLYVFAYGSDPLFTYEAERYTIMSKEMALHIINEVRRDEQLEPLTNIKKVNYFRVA